MTLATCCRASVLFGPDALLAHCDLEVGTSDGKRLLFPRVILGMHSSFKEVLEEAEFVQTELTSEEASSVLNFLVSGRHYLANSDASLGPFLECCRVFGVQVLDQDLTIEEPTEDKVWSCKVTSGKKRPRQEGGNNADGAKTARMGELPAEVETVEYSHDLEPEPETSSFQAVEIKTEAPDYLETTTSFQAQEQPDYEAFEGEVVVGGEGSPQETVEFEVVADAAEVEEVVEVEEDQTGPLHYDRASYRWTGKLNERVHHSRMEKENIRDPRDGSSFHAAFWR